MPAGWWSGEKSRKIRKRIILTGQLTLQTPAHLGNGEGDALADMPLFVDPYDGRTPVIYGASLAGALRAYLEKRLGPGRRSEIEKLFGAEKGDDAGEQSPLIVDDARGHLPDDEKAGVEQRTGVRIDPRSRTARAKKLFEADLWPAGTEFELRFELVVRDGNNGDELKRLLAAALAGLNDGGITLGARKSRGWGKVSAGNWCALDLDLTTTDDLLKWLRGAEPDCRRQSGEQDAEGENARATPAGKERDQGQQGVEDPASALGIAPDALSDRRRFFEMEATFQLAGPLLIRWYGDVGDPDMVHLHSYRPGGRVPVLPGTSLAGVLRARAERIVNTLAPDGRGVEIVERMFGPMLAEDDDAGQKHRVKPRASRLAVEEVTIQNAKDDLIQTRVSIDRFTGGTRHGALFTEKPVFAKPDTTVTLRMRLAEPRDSEIGLLLLLLKDLWTEDLPVGGESSVGRGRLRGVEATLTLHRNGYVVYTFSSGEVTLPDGQTVGALVRKRIPPRPAVWKLDGSSGRVNVSKVGQSRVSGYGRTGSSENENREVAEETSWKAREELEAFVKALLGELKGAENEESADTEQEEK